MSYLQYTRSRVTALLSELERLAHSEFAYPDSVEAFDRLRQLFKTELTSLDKLDLNIDPVKLKQRCGYALNKVADYLPLVGFILRSTNVRNSFEIFSPLLSLARELLEPTIPKNQRLTKLVLSSEWDFSPLTYREIPDLQGFVFIGLPASEAGNPLLIPLAGHELGHSVWAKQGYESSFTNPVIESIVRSITKNWPQYQKMFSPPYTPRELKTNIFAKEIWGPAAIWALRQAEESFCDFLGLAIFGRSFLHAFGYLLSPNFEGGRSKFYPGMRDRVANLIRASQAYQISAPSGFTDLFEDDQPPNIGETDSFKLALADEARESVVQDLIRLAMEVVGSTQTVRSSDAEVERISQRLKIVVPAENTKGIPDILNAAWFISEDPDLWKDMPEVRNNRLAVFQDLIYKNIEIFEIEQRMKQSP